MRHQAQLTAEDDDIWCFVTLRQPWLMNFVLEDHSFWSDARDAELMLTAQRHKGCWAHWASWRKHAVLLRGER